MAYRVARSIDEFSPAEWDAAAGAQLLLTHRWQRVLETSRRNYQPRYLLVEDAQGPLAAATINLADIFGRSGWREWLIRRLTLMVRAPFSTDYGIALRPGAQLSEALPELLRGLGALSWREQRLLLTLNDVPAAEVPTLRAQRFLASDNQPANMNLTLTGATYDDYLQMLSPKDRSELRRMRRRAATMDVRFEHGPLTDDARVFPLVAEVFAHHGKSQSILSITPEFFTALVREMPGEVTIFRGFVGDQLAGVLLCMHQDQTLWWPIAGLHYPLAHPSYLYFLLIDEMIQWAIAHGYRRVIGSMTNEREKRKHGFKPERRWMCVRATIGPVNRLLTVTLPFVQRMVGKSEIAVQVSRATPEAEGGV
jgi:predicted N-acyltransferase